MRAVEPENSNSKAFSKPGSWLFPLSFFVFIGLFVQALDFFGELNRGLIASPAMMALSFYRDFSIYKDAFLSSLSQTLLGFSASLVFGILIAILFSFSNILKKIFLPYAIFFQTVPIIAMAPLLVIYIGFGPETVRFCSFLVSVFPVIATTTLGLESLDSEYLDLFKVYRASKLKTLFLLKIPGAYASIYSGLKISAGLSVIGTISGEFVAGQGLGSLIDTARTQMRVDIIFVAILLSSLIAWFLILCVELLNHLLQSYRPFARNLR